MTNKADGSYSFGKIEYTEADLDKDASGNYVATTKTYKVKEKAGSDSSITYDKNEYTITVTLTDDGKGNINAVADPASGTYVFTNTYHANGTITIGGVKTWDRTLQGNDFEFIITEVADATGTPLEMKTDEANLKQPVEQAETAAQNEVAEEIRTEVFTATVKNDAKGNITFPAIRYTEADAGMHYYKIVERNGGKRIDGTTYDDAEYIVTVTVTDNGDGTMTAESDKQPEKITFANRYEASGDVELGGVKALEGRPLKGEEFEFTMTEVADAKGTPIETDDGVEVLTQTVKNDADGNILFNKISYKVEDAGDHFYKISEVNADETIKGITYDKAEYIVKVTVTDNGDGTVTAEADKKPSQVEFHNRYEASGQVTLKARKEFTNSQIKAGQFSFSLKDADHKVLQTVALPASTGEEGSTGRAEVSFTAIQYTLKDAGQTYTYYITEDIPKGAENRGDGTYLKDGIVYDGHEGKVTVTVTDNGDGTLKAEPVYQSKTADPKKGELFVNRTYGSLEIQKRISGTKTSDSFKFSIRLSAKNSDQTVYPAVRYSDKGDGQKINVSFDEKGFAEISLKADERIVIDKLPFGSAYSVQETDKGSFYLDPLTFNSDGSIGAGTSHVLFINRAADAGTTVEVQKEWNVPDSEKKSLPKSITVELLRTRKSAGKNQKPEVYARAELSAENEWYYEFKNLPVLSTSSDAQKNKAEINAQTAVDNAGKENPLNYLADLWTGITDFVGSLFGFDGDEYEWSVREVDVAGYRGDIEQKGNCFVITNSRIDSEEHEEKSSEEKTSGETTESTTKSDETTGSTTGSDETSTEAETTRYRGGGGGGGGRTVRNNHSDEVGEVLGAVREGDTIAQQVLGADRLPKTGEADRMRKLMEALAAGLLGLLMLALYGVYLRRRSRETK